MRAAPALANMGVRDITPEICLLTAKPRIFAKLYSRKSSLMVKQHDLTQYGGMMKYPG
jgi:hypothetical protein